MPWEVLRTCSFVTARRMDAIGAAWERAADKAVTSKPNVPKVRKATPAEIATGAWH